MAEKQPASGLSGTKSDSSAAATAAVSSEADATTAAAAAPISNPFQPFFFVQMADCQIGMKTFDIEWEDEVEMARQCVAAVNRMQPPPKFATMCGDLINKFPKPDGSHCPIRAKQTADLKGALKDLRSDVPFVCVCGNHDIGQTPTRATIDEWKRTWGPDYTSFVVNNCRMLVVNSQLFKDPSLTEDLAEKQLEWLKNTLAVAAKENEHIIIFSHIPPFVRRPEEGEQWCNLPEHIRKELLDLFVQHGVQKWFCGHFHNNALGHYKDLEVVITNASGTHIEMPKNWDYADGFRKNEQLDLQIGPGVSGFRIVHVAEKAKTSIRHKYFHVKDMPTKLDERIFVVEDDTTADEPQPKKKQAVIGEGDRPKALDTGAVQKQPRSEATNSHSNRSGNNPPT